MQSAVIENEINRDLEQRGYSISIGNSVGAYPRGHQHRGLEILFVKSRSSEFFIGQNRFLLSGGQAILFRGDLDLCARPVQYDYSRTVLHFCSELAPSRNGLFLNSIVQNRAYVCSLKPDGAARFHWVIKELVALSHACRFPHTVVTSLVDLILAELQEASSQDLAQPAIVRDIMNYMRINITSYASLTDLYGYFFYSPSHLRQLFKEQVGCSPQQYWLQLKINHSCELLRSMVTIRKVASLVGFTNVRSYQRAFKQAMGISPSEYRNGLFVNDSPTEK